MDKENKSRLADTYKIIIPKKGYMFPYIDTQNYIKIAISKHHIACSSWISCCDIFPLELEPIFQAIMEQCKDNYIDPIPYEKIDGEKYYINLHADVNIFINIFTGQEYVTDALFKAFDNEFDDPDLPFIAYYIVYRICRLKKKYESPHSSEKRREFLIGIIRTLNEYNCAKQSSKSDCKELSFEKMTKLADEFLKKRNIVAFLKKIYREIHGEKSLNQIIAIMKNDWHFYGDQNYENHFLPAMRRLKLFFEGKIDGIIGYEKNDLKTVTAVCLLLFYAFIPENEIPFKTFRKYVMAYWGIEGTYNANTEIKDIAYLIYIYSSQDISRYNKLPIWDNGFWPTLEKMGCEKITDRLQRSFSNVGYVEDRFVAETKDLPFEIARQRIGLRKYHLRRGKDYPMDNVCEKHTIFEYFKEELNN